MNETTTRQPAHAAQSFASDHTGAGVSGRPSRKQEERTVAVEGDEAWQCAWRREDMASLAPT